MTASSRRAIVAAIAAVVAAALLYFSLRGIAWHEVWRVIRSARPELLLLVAAMSSVTLFLRSYRWRILLRAGGRVTVGDAFRATAAGYFANNFLPARAGEVIRSVIV